MILTKPPQTPRKPLVSVIMANYNGAAYLSDAIGSVLNQSLSDLELIVSDDASTDDSVRMVIEAMVADPRIRLVRSEQNRGPGAARNKALDIAKGDWIAIFDSDDLMHSDRLAMLVEAAKRDEADIVADGLVEFADGRSIPHPPPAHSRSSEPSWVSVDRYIQTNQFYGSERPLGYLKPLFRAQVLANPVVRYDETLRIGEDFDLVLRLLHSGSRLGIYPFRCYYYRKRATSISHRLSLEALLALKTANSQLLSKASSDNSLRALFAARARSIETALTYERILVALKAREFWGGFRLAIVRPQAALLLRLPIGVRIRRLLPFWLGSPPNAERKLGGG